MNEGRLDAALNNNKKASQRLHGHDCTCTENRPLRRMAAADQPGMRTLLRQDPRDEFSGAVREYKSGAIKLSFVDVAQARLYRTEHEVAQSDSRHFFAAFQLQGEANMEQGGNRVRLAPGDITLIDSSLPSDFTYGANSRQLSLILPRHLVEQNLRYGSVRCAQKIAATSPIALLTHRLVLEASQHECLSQHESEATLDAVVSLLRPAISAVDAEGDVHERVFRKTLDFIDAHIRSEELCPELLAREVGVSVRGLYRMFSRKGLVVAQYIKNRRLDFCAESLRLGGAERSFPPSAIPGASRIPAISPPPSRRASAFLPASTASATSTRWSWGATVGANSFAQAARSAAAGSQSARFPVWIAGGDTGLDAGAGAAKRVVRARAWRATALPLGE